MRPCTANDIKKLQKFADRAYRYVWNNGKPRALIRLLEKINSFQLGRKLQIESKRTNIEIRALERLGHVLRRPDKRMVKKVALGGRNDGEQISTDIMGGRERTERGTLRGNTVQYWRRLMREAGMEEDNTVNLAKDKVMERGGEQTQKSPQRMGRDGDLQLASGRKQTKQVPVREKRGGIHVRIAMQMRGLL